MSREKEEKIIYGNHAYLVAGFRTYAAVESWQVMYCFKAFRIVRGKVDYNHPLHERVGDDFDKEFNTIVDAIAKGLLEWKWLGLKYYVPAEELRERENELRDNSMPSLWEANEG